MSAAKSSWTNEELRAAHEASSLPVPHMRRSAVCGCFFCLATFPSAEVREHANIAWCPHCEIDSVLPENEVPEVRNPAFLRAMHAFWF